MSNILSAHVEHPYCSCRTSLVLMSNILSARKATSGSAGYDLYSGEDAVVPASKVRVVDTHVSVTIPLDCDGRVARRSSLVYRLIDVGGGVIDSDYKDTIWVVIYFGTDDFVIKAGDRIA